MSVFTPVLSLEVAMYSRRSVRFRLLFVILAFLLHCRVGLAPDAQAVTFMVNSTADVVDENPSSGRCQDNRDIACTTDADCTNAGFDGPCNLCATGGATPSAPTTPECTLRAAIQQANATSGADTISIPAGTYTLTIPGAGENAAATGDLDITDDLTIIGEGLAITIIQACTVDQKTAPCPAGEGINDDRVFHIDPIPTGIIVNLSDMTIQNGGPDSFAFHSPHGAGILLGVHVFFSAGVGTLTLSNSAVRNNASPGVGGGILNNGGTLHVIDSIINGNLASADGGGIANNGSLTVSNSTISDNTNFGSNPGGGGGGIVSYGGVVNINRSTISGNGKPVDAPVSGGGAFLTLGCGGGLRIDAGELMVTNSTISGNRGGDTGGGLCIGNVTGATLNSNTITGNTTLLPATGQGGGGIIGGLQVTLRNTIVAGNTAASNIGHDCRGAFTSAGYNLIGNAIPAPGTPPWCTLTAAPGDQVGSSTIINPHLAPLTDNGGPTQTHALCAGPGAPDASCTDPSPAIDAGNPAAPGSGGNACEATDQRGVNRLQDGNGDGIPICDIGAFERLTVVAPLSGIRPDTGGHTGSILALIYGSGFENGTTVRLTHAGEPDIAGEMVQVGESGAVMTAHFDLTGRALGLWDLQVTNPGGPPIILADAFTIEEGRKPELWADIVSPSVIRAGRPARLLLLYGNRGNVDAHGAPLVIGVPRTMTFTPRFPLTPPPFLPGQATIDWSRVPATMGEPQLPDLQVVSLFLPVAPAGFVGTLEFSLTPPLSALGKSVEIGFGIGAPYFQSPLDPQVLARLTKGVRSYARRILEIGFGRDRDPQLQALITAHLQDAVDAGLAALANSSGTNTPVYAVPHFLISAATAAGSAGSGAENCKDGVDNDSDGLVDANDPDCDEDGDDDDCDDCCDDCDDEPECEPEEAENPWYGDDDCDGEPDCKEGGFNTCAPPPCDKWPPTACGGPPPGGPVPIGPYDPNEKVGSAGAGAGHYITGVDPLRYVVLFENLETATAPAQEVVITDQLDMSKLDLSTFSLGPISFGANTVAPPPGLSEFTKEIDLRPAQNLICRIETQLALDMGLLTWRLTSLDPATGELPEDPLLGCLPPNVASPEGEGSVLFTVKPKPGLATNTEIRNQARIVFDVNPPIDTPEWLNTIDNSKPQSQVTAVNPQLCSQELQVQWSGTDTGSGLQSYDVLVSEDGGPFTVWLNDTTATTGVFIGKWGKSYAFYSVARDQTGNVEDAPASADAVETIIDCGGHDLAVTKITTAKAVTLTSKNPRPQRLVKVQIQNRSPHAEVINNRDALKELVHLVVESLGVQCPAPPLFVKADKPQKTLPLTLKSKQKLNVVFVVTFGCANDPTRGANHEDYRLSATIGHNALGGADMHVTDDVCPRSVTPPFEVDPNPNGTIKDMGCGAKKADKTFGDPVLVDVIVKP